MWTLNTIFFLIRLCISLIGQILAIVFCIKAIKANRNDKDGDKYNKNIAYCTLCASIAVLVPMLIIEIPAPQIHLLNNGLQINKDEYEVEISNIDIFETYYTIDGSDPENGIKYIGSFMVHNPTAVLAKSKFLWWWSGEAKFTYPFENLGYNNQMQPTEMESSEIVILDEINETETQIEEKTTTEEMPNEVEQQDSSQINSETTTQKDLTDMASDNNSSPAPQETKPSIPNEGLNYSEGSALLTYINQYRTQSGLNELVWNPDLEQAAQRFAEAAAKGESITVEGFFYPIGRQCNGAKNAQRAVSDWITGNDYIPSEAEQLLNSNYTQMGGALYYLPDGNEYGYHYFWYICLQ